MLKLYRLAHWAFVLGVPFVPRIIYGLNRIVFAVVLPPSVTVGSGTVFGYSGLGTVVHPRCKIGARVVVGTNVTIGGRGHEREVPIIEDDVYIGNGAKILGPIVIGTGAQIGAPMADIRYPPFVGARGPGYWLRPSNVWASRQGVLRLDYSNDWRYAFGAPDPPDRVVPVVRLLPPGRQLTRGFRFIILGDTGEGDRSQYGLLPLLRALKPDFMIINGDVAYPAGRAEGSPEQNDFLLGFFQPYRNFRCAIWATPGNHEDYSANSGRDFYDIFCTRRFDALWAEHGLRHDTLQPGMYWELSDPTETSKSVWPSGSWERGVACMVPIARA